MKSYLIYTTSAAFVLLAVLCLYHVLVFWVRKTRFGNWYILKVITPLIQKIKVAHILRCIEADIDVEHFGKALK